MCLFPKPLQALSTSSFSMKWTWMDNTKKIHCSFVCEQTLDNVRKHLLFTFLLESFLVEQSSNICLPGADYYAFFRLINHKYRIKTLRAFITLFCLQPGIHHNLSSSLFNLDWPMLYHIFLCVEYHSTLIGPLFQTCSYLCQSGIHYCSYARQNIGKVPGSQNTGHQSEWQCVCRGCNLGQALSAMCLQKSSITVETQQLWRKHVLNVSPIHSKHDTTESCGQQSENIVLFLHVQIIATFIQHPSYFCTSKQC